MENQRDDLAVIFAGYKPRAWILSSAAIPAWRRGVAHHLDFPTTASRSCCRSPSCSPPGIDYRFDAEGLAAMREYIGLRIVQPHFANARSMRNALDRARLRRPDACSPALAAAQCRIATA